LEPGLRPFFLKKSFGVTTAPDWDAELSCCLQAMMFVTIREYRETQISSGGGYRDGASRRVCHHRYSPRPRSEAAHLLSRASREEAERIEMLNQTKAYTGLRMQARGWPPAWLNAVLMEDSQQVYSPFTLRL
jgi:hypothetical protein